MNPQEIENRIAEIKNLQDIEAAAGYPYGDLWNDLQDKLWNLEHHDQESDPEPIYAPEGYHIGYRLETGEEILYGDMNFYNQD